MNDKNDRAESLGTSGAPTGDAGREPTQKPDGLGEDGTIPPHPDGVAAGHSGEKSTFEPEEDDTAE